LFDVELLERELKNGHINYVSEIVQNEQDFTHALIHFVPDIILADYTFPSFDGPAAFKIREKLAPGTPFIFVSGTIGEERSIELIKTGVTDYVLKDNLITLNPKLLRALREAKEKQEKKETEQKLALNEQLLSRAQRLGRMGNWELDFTSDIVRCSDETSRIYGLPPGHNRMSNENGLQLVHTEDVDYVIKKIEESRDLLLDLSIHYRIVHTDGSIRHIYSEGKHEFDANGRPAGLYGIVQDVTDMIILENKITAERLSRQKEITDAVLTALENERTHIGNELNENLNQLLATAKMYIHLSAKMEDKRHMYLDMSCCFIMEVMLSIQKISKTLVFPSVHITNVVGNIKNLMHDLSLIHPLIIEFSEDNFDVNLLHEKLQLTIFRIVQEQVNNILTHANATHAVINLSRLKNEIILCISDNGEGCDMMKQKKGVGIINIKTRAELHDGRIAIVSEPGQGYELRVELSGIFTPENNN
ncbi:MAG TPA: PAS domain-containing protein, partial [Ferruginibacter sp.]|nr:PAS domain-containing protein [Ferruginibacter sp.]